MFKYLNYNLIKYWFYAFFTMHRLLLNDALVSCHQKYTQYQTLSGQMLISFTGKQRTRGKKKKKMFGFCTKNTHNRNYSEFQQFQALYQFEKFSCWLIFFCHFNQSEFRSQHNAVLMLYVYKLYNLNSHWNFKKVPLVLENAACLDFSSGHFPSIKAAKYVC